LNQKNVVERTKGTELATTRKRALVEQAHRELPHPGISAGRGDSLEVIFIII
jgi:hypothetical protein